MKRRKWPKALALMEEFVKAYDAYQIVLQAMRVRQGDRPHPQQCEIEAIEAAKMGVQVCYGELRKMLGVPESPIDQLAVEYLARFEDEQRRNSERDQPQGRVDPVAAGIRNTLSDGSRGNPAGKLGPTESY